MRLSAQEYKKLFGKKSPATFEASEHDEQVAFFDEMAWRYPKLYDVAYAIPNGGDRDIRVATNLKKEGVKAGVLDISIDEPMHGFHGLKIEMKRSKSGKLSPEQNAWCRKLIDRNYAVAVCHGSQQAINAVKRYIAGEFKQYEV